MRAFQPQCVKAGLDAAQTLKEGQLSKDHGQMLLPTRELSCAGIATITRYTVANFAVG
jgi:hypothetical protein